MFRTTLPPMIGLGPGSTLTPHRLRELVVALVIDPAAILPLAGIDPGARPAARPSREAVAAWLGILDAAEAAVADDAPSLANHPGVAAGALLAAAGLGLALTGPVLLSPVATASLAVAAIAAVVTWRRAGRLVEAAALCDRKHAALHAARRHLLAAVRIDI